MVVFFFKAKFLIFLTAFEKKGGVCGVKIFDGAWPGGETDLLKISRNLSPNGFGMGLFGAH